MTYSIVIATYDRPESLSRCLEAVSRQKEIDRAEVIVVDDGSPADFKAIERNWKTKLNLRYVKIPHGGRAAARNRGVRAAEGRRIVFLDDDILVRPGWFARHADVADPKIAVLGPYPLKGPDGRDLGGSDAFRSALEPVRFDLIQNPDNAGFAFFATGNLSMEKEAFDEIGGFDDRFKHWGWEDIDLGYRFERAGGRLVYDPEARAVHAHRTMTRGDLWEREFQGGITAYQFWSKWRSDDVKFMKFWKDDDRGGAAWRRSLGAAAIEVVERIAPGSRLLSNLYERMIYSYRTAGVAEGRRLHGESPEPPLAETPAEGRP